MSSSGPSILLIGASGYIGRPLAQEFIRQKDKFSRLAILTEESKKEKFSEVAAQGFELVYGSFYDVESFKGFNTVISLLGDHAMKFQPAIIEACVAAGVTDFYPSEYGSDIEQGDYPKNRYFRDKILTRDAARKAVADQGPDGTFNYTLMVVGGFMEYLAHPLFGCDVKEKTFTFYGKAEKTEAVTAVVDVAKYIVASTLLPKSPTHAREFKVPGGVFSWAEIIATISKTSGVEYKDFWLSNEDADKLAAEAAEKGDVMNEIGYSLKSLMGRAGQFGVPEPWNHDQFPEIVPQGLEVTLKAFFDAQK